MPVRLPVISRGAKFDWAGVAAAGIGAGVGTALAPSIGRAGLGMLGARAATVGAISIADAASRSAIEGSSFGKNLLDAIPGAVGQVLGGAIGDALNRTPQGARATRALERAKTDTKAGTSRNAIGDVELAPGRIDTTGELIALDLGGASNGSIASGTSRPDARQSRRSPAGSPVNELLVVASRQTVADVNYLTDAEFGRIDSTARQLGLESDVENAIISDYAARRRVVDGLVSGFGRFVGTLGGAAQSFSEGAVDGVNGIAGVVHIASEAGKGNFAPLSGAVTSAVRSVRNGEPFLTVANAFDQLITHDNPSPLVRLSGAAAPGIATDGLSRLGITRGGVVAAKSGDALLLERGVTDAGLRQSILDTGFDPAILNEASPLTLRRFDKLFQGTLDAGKGFRGRLGNLSTRARTIEIAVDIDRLGLAPEFESLVRLDGGRNRFVDVAGLDESGVSRYFQLYKEAKAGGIPLRETNTANDIF